MPAKDRIIDLSQIDFTQTVADLEEIRKYNAQRYEMEQVTAIVYEDPQNHILVGYKDLSDDEFWIRGHMPGMPLLPGVIMCESAAQMSSYYVQKYDLMGAEMIGFGGMDEVRFRDFVIPGDRLVLALTMVKLRPRRMCVSRFEGYVDGQLVAEGQILGIPLPLRELRKAIAARQQSAQGA